jgi:N-methylhydantoinase A
VTDADVLLGYLDPSFFLGGTMPLDPERAESAIMRAVAEPTGQGAAEAAGAVRAIVDESMASAIRMYALEHGQDPARLPLVAFGGAGPVHAVSVCRILGVRRLIVPIDAGVSSAHGLLTAPLSFDFVRSAPAMLDEVDWSWVSQQFDAMELEGRAILGRAGVPAERVDIRRLGDLRFYGQGTEISVEVPAGTVDGPIALDERFRDRYSTLYRHVPSDVPLEVISWRLVASGPRPGSAPARLPVPGEAVKGTRSVYWSAEDGFVETRVLDRERLRPGDRFQGPLIIEERESTTVADLRSTITVDERLNLVVDLY